MPDQPQAEKRERSRIDGLDTLRAFAILLVFMFHYLVFVSGKPTFGWASTLGWTGVDLFFVLSGYLISNQIFSGMAKGKGFSLKAFYARRALRTLPNYYIVLALYFCFPTLFGSGVLPPLWKFLTFTQNYHLKAGTQFSHAWSLCIEEQFYLVLPAVSLVAFRYLSKEVWWVLVALLMIAGIAIRSILWIRYGLEDGEASRGYYPNIYYSTFCRADEFLPGVAIAMAKNFYPELWTGLMKRGMMLTVLGIALVAVLSYGLLNYYQIDGYGYGYFMTAFGYSLVAIAFGVLVLAALSPGSPLHRIRIPGAKSLALWSYAIYLSHKPLAFVLKNFLVGRDMDPGSWGSVAIIGVSCVVVGWLLFVAVETPFMKVRAKWFPSNSPSTPS